MSNVSKSDLVDIVAAKAGLSKKDAGAAVNAVFDAIAENLANGNKVQVIGFGNFEVKDAPAREGRNPKTGETITIPASKKPVFSASKVLKEQVNG